MGLFLELGTTIYESEFCFSQPPDFAHVVHLFFSPAWWVNLILVWTCHRQSPALTHIIHPMCHVRLVSSADPTLPVPLSTSRFVSRVIHTVCQPSMVKLLETSLLSPYSISRHSLWYPFVCWLNLVSPWNFVYPHHSQLSGLAPITQPVHWPSLVSAQDLGLSTSCSWSSTELR